MEIKLSNELTSTVGSLKEKPLEELATYIESVYHEKLRKDFPELIFRSDKVEKVHADHSECPKGVTKKLQEIQSDLYEHMMKEERVLFPMIKNGIGRQAQMPISIMKHEHEIHEKNLKELRELPFDYKLPNGACGTWTSLYNGLRQLESDLNDHIYLENYVLFAKVLES